jgi:WD40 repeat protein/serine/threonine protein kinase
VGEACSLESLVGQLADEFLRRHDAGERPDVEEYVARYPQAADLLRKVLTSLRLLDTSLSGGAVSARHDGGAAAMGTLGDFRLIREVGRGGMGVVYEAEQVSLGRRVALKVLPFAATMDPRHLQRFQNEARAAASLHHEHIVPVYGVGQERGVHYYAMQFIDGQTLAQLMARGRGGAPADTVDRTHAPSEPAAAPPAPAAPTTVARAADTAIGPRPPADYRAVAGWVAQAAEALEHAHQRGVVHRDVKPSNLMLDGTGKVWVADFGLARVGADGGLTGTGDVIGTLRYMSPEQATAKHGLVDHRTDVYGLGATLYELLAGRPAFEGDNPADLLPRVVLDEPAPPRSSDRGIPADLETITLKALAKEPAERYATAQELADDLRRWLEDRPIRAKAPSFPQRLRKWALRHAAVVRAAVVVLVLTAFGSAAAASLIWQQQQETQGALDDRTKALDAQTKALAEKDAALKREQEALSLARIILANREQWVADYDQVQKQLDLCPTELRQWEWHYLARACRRSRQPAPLTLQHTGHVESLAYSADGQRLAAGNDKGTVKVWDVLRGKELFTLQGHAKVDCVALSRDGQRLAAGMDDGTLKVWATQTQHELHVLRAHRANVWCVAFSPDGERLASGSEDGTARVWDLQTGRESSSTQGPLPIYAVTFGPDGKRFATGGRDRRVKVWDASNGKELLSLQGHTNNVYDVSFSPDGKWLVSAGWDGTAKVWDAGTGDALMTLFGHQGPVSHVAFLPDARLVGFSNRPGLMKEWGLKGGRVPRSRELRSCSVAGGIVASAISPEGRWLAVGIGPRVQIWDTMNTPDSLILAAGTTVILGLAFSPDGNQVAAASADGTVRLCDATSGQLVRTFVHEGGSVMGVAFSADGRLLASASADRTAKVWDVVSGREIYSLGHAEGVYGVTFSPDGSLVASTSGGGAVRLWSTATGQLVHTLEGQGDFVCGAAFSPDSRRLASVTSQGKNRYRVKLSDVATGLECQVKLPPQEAPIGTPVFSADGSRVIAQVESQGTKIWDATTGQELHGLPAVDTVVTALSPDGQRLAAHGSDSSVQLRDTTTGEVVLTLRGHTSPVMALAFSPDGRRLASGDQFGTVRVWDATPLAEK